LLLTLVLEAAGALLLALAGTAMGYGFSRLKRPWWLLGYFVPLAMVVAIGLARLDQTLAFVAPFSWIAMGRRMFLFIALSSSVLFMTPLSRLRTRGQKRGVVALMIFVVIYFGIAPFLAPIATYSFMKNLKSRVTGDGVCLQSTQYNCGPAAAVTALLALGLEGQEGEIAIRSCTSDFIGTPPSLLCSTLNELYGERGLQASYRKFGGIDALRDHLPVIAVTKYGFLVDHYVVVMEILSENVVVGDPLCGRRLIGRKDFGEIWRSTAIVISFKR
jgi:hypothetical protein